MNALPDPALTRAVLVGVGAYAHLEPLPAATRNLPALAAVLTGPLSWQLPAEHCTVVCDPASMPDMLDPVKRAADEAEDTLLVYFAGHGLLDGRGELFFGLPGSQSGWSYTGVTHQALREIILSSPAGRCIVILDCCMSGRALGLMGSDDTLADQAEIDGSYLLAAAPDNSPALAPPGQTHTAFTGQLLKTLEHGVPGPERELDLDLVYQQVRRELVAQNLPEPQKRIRNTAGRLVLARNPAYRPASIPAGARAVKVPWPDPGRFRTPLAFLEALGEVRALSGLTLQAVSEQTAPAVAAGTIGQLLNRTTLPRTWKTTRSYLAACGVPDRQCARWEAAWVRLRAQEQTETTAVVPEPAPARGWHARLCRRRGIDS
ncbi:caspase domain-containing protein [Streptomyces sp. NPDC102384]|uniref:caspase family protein n=1 Tax=Streptomyces sp. NPDC102384 TaxID=3366166 RepID=UPI0038149FDE